MPPSSARRSAIESYEARILAYERGLAPAPARPPSSPAAGARRRPSFTRLRRILVFAWLLLAADVALSFGGAMLRPANTGFSIRAVEWLRDNGAAGLVSDVEAIFYSLSAPSTGGTALKALPQVGVGAAAPDRAGAASPSASASASVAGPAPIAPVISPALPGEGRWRGTGPLVRGAPPVMVTTFRPDPNYPRMVAGVAWIDSSRAWVQLYPGRYEPPGAGGTPAEVPPPLRGELLATFNSGFKLADSGAGFVAFGHVYAPLKQDQATFLRDRDGPADIRTWTGGPSPGPGVEFARQNLPLLVQGGRLSPLLGDGSLWGATLGNAVRVWRSGVGLDARGNLLYGAADDQTAASLAEILQRAGAVRAMELDINSEWVTFNFFTAFGQARAAGEAAGGAGEAAVGGAGPQKLLAGMTRPATRYIAPDDRDFFAVYARRG